MIHVRQVKPKLSQVNKTHVLLLLGARSDCCMEVMTLMRNKIALLPLLWAHKCYTEVRRQTGKTNTEWLLTFPKIGSLLFFQSNLSLSPLCICKGKTAYNGPRASEQISFFFFFCKNNTILQCKTFLSHSLWPHSSLFRHFLNMLKF